MKPPKREQTIFAEALRLPPEERAAYLSQATAGDPLLAISLHNTAAPSSDLRIGNISLVETATAPTEGSAEIIATTK